MANEQKVIEIKLSYDQAFNGLISLQEEVKKLTAEQKENKRQTDAQKESYAQNTIALKEKKEQITALIKEVRANIDVEKELYNQARKVSDQIDVRQAKMRMYAEMFDTISAKEKAQSELLKQVAKEEEQARKLAETAAKNQAKEMAILDAARVKENARIQEESRILSGGTGSVNDMTAKLNLLIKTYNNLSQSVRESQFGVNMNKDILALRSQVAGIEQSYGNFSKNVGNYSSATKGLNISLSQIMSELPNMANGMRIFTMSISNNLPMVVQNIQALRAENKLLAAEGKPTTSVLKTVASSFFGIAGMANIAMLAFQLLTPTIEKWTGSLFNGKKQSDEFSKSLKSQTEVMQDAMKDGGVYKQAIENIQKVTTAQRQYEKGIMSAKEFTQIYNETLGDTFGKAKSAGEAIKSIADKKDAYINAMKSMTYANALFAASAQDMVKILEIQIKSNSDMLGEQSSVFKKAIEEVKLNMSKYGDQTGLLTYKYVNGQQIIASSNTEMLQKISASYNEAANKQRRKQILETEKHQQLLEKQAQIYADRAQTTAQKSNITLTKIEEEKQKKEKKQAEEKLMTMKDIADEQIKILESELDAYIAINQAKINDEEITQAEIFRIQKENAEKRKQIEQDILDERLLANEISFDEYYNLSQEVNAKYAKSIVKTDSDIAKHKKVVEAINLSNQIEAIKNNAIRETAERRKSLKEQEDDEIYKAEKSGADQYLIRAKYAELNKEIDKDVENSKLESISSLAGAIGSFFGKNTIAAKAAGVAEASINGYLAVQKALASFPPPFNYIAAAAVGIQAAANVKNILAVDTSAATSAASAVSSSQSKPKTYHTGGDITNDGTANRSGEIGITALVGEKMMNRNAANMFSPILDQMNAAGIGRSSLSGLSFAPQFNYSLFAKATAAAVASLPAPEVSVKEISKVNTRVTTIKEIGSYSSKK